VGSAPDENRFTVVANRRDGCTMVSFWRSRRRSVLNPPSMFRLLAPLFLIAVGSQPGHPQTNDSVYWFCSTSDSRATAWYSEVFPGPNKITSQVTYSSAFRNFVEANYDHEVLGAVFCRSKDQRGEARSERDWYKAHEVNKKVIQTTWTY